MPAISDLQYGYDSAGLETYLSEIKSTVIDEASSAIEDISSITTVCEQEWEGKARDNFVTNLGNDARHVSEQLQSLYSILVTEIHQVQAAMSNKDEELIKL